MKHNMKNIDNKDSFRATLDGKSMQTIEDLFYETSNKLLFPDYFGNNWDAFDECLNDLDWIEQKNVILTVVNKEYILAKYPYHQEDIFFRLLRESQDEWNQKDTKKVHFII